MILNEKAETRDGALMIAFRTLKFIGWHGFQMAMLGMVARLPDMARSSCKHKSNYLP